MSEIDSFVQETAAKYTNEELVKRVLDVTNLNLELLALLKVLTSDSSSPSVRAEARSHSRDLIRTLDEHFEE